MSEKSMSDALAKAQANRGEPTVSTEDLAAKKRAMESPEVFAFIKEGAVPLSTELPPIQRPAAHVDPMLIQMNAKIPEDLYQRSKRAVFENQLSRLEPSSLQELVSQALRAELRRLGY